MPSSNTAFLIVITFIVLVILFVLLFFIRSEHSKKESPQYSYPSRSLYQ